ncbi:MAG: glycerol-3-phosphate dehydrogenase C-terminal domain-containing protein, partial [Stenotrophobium sp.]
ELLREHPAWRERIHAEAPFIQAEAILAVRDEMALSLDDVIRRRMPLSLLVHDAGNWRARVEQLIAPEMLRSGIT